MARKLGYLIIILLVAFVSFFAGSLMKQRSGPKSPIPEQHNPEETALSRESQGDPAPVSPSAFRISPGRRQIVGIGIGEVEKKPLIHMVRLLGKVAPDETRLYFINATVDGWITEAHGNTTGSYVRKNETLATFYSPEFLSAAQALLFALNAKDRAQTTGRESPAQKDQLAQFEINLKQYRDSLRNLGMGDLQIDEMIDRRRYMENVNITSPTDGIILSRNISQGLRFEKGRELYRIADLSRVWIVADVFEYEAQFFKPGSKATVWLPYQKKKYQATVSEVLPVFDPATRTLKVRLETDNPGFILRPDMFVDIELPIKMPPAITVPADAILNSGLRKAVFVDKGNGFFEQRKVETGYHLGDRVEITRGLVSGERIVTSGNFFVDSESRLQLAAQGIYGEMSLDPVCGMGVDEARARSTGEASVYRNKTYSFCSTKCREQFDKSPDRYARP